MYLKNVSYEIWDKKSLIWKVSNISLERLNLVVGKNATGKSRFLSILGDITSKFGSKNNKNWTVDYLAFEVGSGFKSIWNFDFIDLDKNTYQYFMIVGFEQIIEEELIFNGKVVLKRNKYKTELYSTRLNKRLLINPPSNKLTFEVRRDLIEFPFFEKIINWSENATVLTFSEVDDDDFGDKVIPILKRFTKSQIESVILSMNQIGFQIEKLKIRKGGVEFINIHEKGIKVGIAPYEMSRGMFRALNILINIELLLQKEASVIAIDDLGEGLDYERATKLGKLLVQKLENSNIQFIATSNDSFLMDVVPIKYWNILQRDGNTVRALNYQNSKEQFDEFKLSGLSNFYLFSSDFLTQKQD